MKNFDTQTIQNLDSLPMPELPSCFISAVGYCDFAVIRPLNAMIAVIYIELTIGESKLGNLKLG